jgi:hypothetical protein
MGTLPQPATALEVEQPATSRSDDMGPPAEVDGGSTATTKEHHMAGLKVECRPSGTLAERPQ